MTLVEFRMPALGADMEAGTVSQWNVRPGSAVKRGDIVAVVETDKGAIDVEIFDDGVFREILVPEGTRVSVGTVLALLGGASTAGAVAPAAPAVTAAAAPAPVVASPAPAAAPPTPPVLPARRPRASPAAQRRAHELGVALDALAGSGPGGVVTLQDVERAAATVPAAVPAAAAPRPPPGASMRDAIAAAMSRSKREIPHYYLSMTLDVTPVMDWLTARNAGVPVTERLMLPVLLLRSVALAAAAIEGFSGFYRDGRYERAEQVHVGMAVAIRGGGLVAPAVMDTATRPLADIMEDLRELVARARAGRLRASELAAPTIILTSLGDAALESVFPIIQPPQVAIVGAGAVLERPWVVGGQVAARQVLTLSLAADHRVTDGRSGAQFLARIAELLQAPAAL
jgi:pyruvate dehydrogenase E2 component (dihydrolipoamide acetyltransferase)